MSRTLFWYIFLNLLGIFGMTSGVLSAIMSFGGLLRPLYEFGLGISQVGQILGWSGPAMTAYSLPIAALFATTIVYGRLGADNEITACRAAGMSHLAMAMPAFVLGLVTAFISLGLLCFVVPASMLKVEKIVYSNLADLAVSQIERTHQIRMDQNDPPITVFADSARVLDVDPKHPRNQTVQFDGPLIVEYESAVKNKPPVPKQFYMASQATAYIRQQNEDDDPSMIVSLSGGTRFPRELAGSDQQSARIFFGEQQLGPVPIQSPVRENTKFMDIFRLQTMIEHPEQSRRVRKLMREFIRRDQEKAYLLQLLEQLNGPTKSVQITGSNDTFIVTRANAAAELRKDRLAMNASPQARVRVVQTKGSQSLITIDAAQVEVRASADADDKQIRVTLEMLDCVLTQGGMPTGHRNFSRSVTIPMPESVYALTSRTAADYAASPLGAEDKNRLKRDLLKLTNSAISEIHARTSFAVSCLILVMVGCALGMMFRSGNFLSAFAVSVIPALMSIALIVTGQHTCENIPWSVADPNWVNPLNFGLVLIWAGNAAVFLIAAVLLTRLQRQ